MSTLIHVCVVQGEMGTHEVLVPVKAASAQRTMHGTSKVLTPVRRSRRSVAPSSPAPTIQAQLEATQFAYSPNPALGRARVESESDMEED